MSADTKDAGARAPAKGLSLTSRLLRLTPKKDAKAAETAKADEAAPAAQADGAAQTAHTKSETAKIETSEEQPKPPVSGGTSLLGKAPGSSLLAAALGARPTAEAETREAPEGDEPAHEDEDDEASEDAEPAPETSLEADGSLPPEAKDAMSEIKAALGGDAPDTKRLEFKAPPAPPAVEEEDEEAAPEADEPEIKDAVITEAAGESEPEAAPAAPAAPEPVPFVRFAGVKKTYDGIALVVKDLSLDIEKGEFLTLLGPSGSGKTTTLMMLAGFETPTEGDISLNGKSIGALAPHQRGLGFVFQNYALFPHMTVAENLAFPLEVRRKPKSEIRERISRALKMVELEGFEKRKPHQLSGGQQQRIAVARALVFDPELVLMDEPLGALDKHLREQMQYELKRLHRELGVTMVYVTHDQSEALTLSDRIAVFHEGKIQQLDTPQQIYDAPANAFVAGFIGENNALSGRVVGAGEEAMTTIELAGGTRVKAIKGNCGGVGSAALVCVRPESLTLSEETGPSRGENQLAAMVDDLVFHGDHVRVKLSSTGGHEIVVKAPARQTTIPAKGVAVTLSWEPYACRAFAPL